jgi:two-component system chemotaxis sensor kinase CheA
MNSLLEQFLAEAHELLIGISDRILLLEDQPDSVELINDLFRMVHTLKGNSGLFDFPELTRVLHAGEDLLDSVREGQLPYSQALADHLLEAMDFVTVLLDEIAHSGAPGAGHAGTSAALAGRLRDMLGAVESPPTESVTTDATSIPSLRERLAAAAIPGSQRLALQQEVRSGTPLTWVEYAPDAECFFRGEDPLHQVLQVPDVAWRAVTAQPAWPALAVQDPYHCQMVFRMLSRATPAALEALFRYMPESTVILPVSADALVDDALPAKHPSAASAIPATAGTAAHAALCAIVLGQCEILALPHDVPWAAGRLGGVVATLASCLAVGSSASALAEEQAGLSAAGRSGSPEAVLAWLQQSTLAALIPVVAAASAAAPRVPPGVTAATASSTDEAGSSGASRRTDDASAPNRTLKVDQVKIDRLMSLVGEMVVAKNSLPYLANRAEMHFGVRELGREIKAQFAVINRIAEELQDAVMQVRMMPVSFIFQRFPRLVRDTSRKLGKDVTLVLEGEETQADKNVVEALADPLIHIVRNSLDHGIESPAERAAAGKPVQGRLTIRASQQGDRVVIEVSDDGKGIDPEVIKRKALEKGLVDVAAVAAMSDQEAVNLVFSAGFSTSEVVSDLSGRGVGMDVVRNAVEKLNGSVGLSSSKGQGTTLRLSLPLSMAVTHVMIVESDRQIFGVPMDMVLETVRVPRAAVRMIKSRRTTVLRGRIVPLLGLNDLLAVAAEQRTNDADEFAALVVRLHGEQIGILVDDFREAVDVILKPMGGILGGLSGYAGSALLGDGSVLMVLDPKELV